SKISDEDVEDVIQESDSSVVRTMVDQADLKDVTINRIDIEPKILDNVDINILRYRPVDDDFINDDDEFDETLDEYNDDTLVLDDNVIDVESSDGESSDDEEID
ncbi:hypothetical protein PanWU01x14_251980, partial [Parasponia andersonii]